MRMPYRPDALNYPPRPCPGRMKAAEAAAEAAAAATAVKELSPVVGTYF